MLVLMFWGNMFSLSFINALMKLNDTVNINFHSDIYFSSLSTLEKRLVILKERNSDYRGGEWVLNKILC
jgi:cytoplasmic iron level regulating protein YaaA (DUF328/UPF0246 family)